ncbi:AAA family ATPase [Streptomyces sp. Isolate_219]|uniref:AAA family ATPase n=1 Tax=Streptomyces sp. Isolate_219 TaxID=2950110 RepID=UPI0021C5A194|nr:ATP-binding protein [Streptomyces sp. Isolate_219]MCR8576345.1 AAA family ATPase [Streptomyces sp. Isolate_219]
MDNRSTDRTAPAAQPARIAGHALVGREAEMELFGAFLAGVPRLGRSLVVLGELGVGKTALLAAVVGHAEAAGMRVLTATGVEYRAQTSYGALRQLLTSVPESRAAVADLPALAAALDFKRGRAPGQDAVAEAVVTLVAKLSRKQPVLLVLDDAQWLDRASAAILGRVVRRLPDSGAGTVCSVRLGDESFFDHSGLPLHEPRPLSEAAEERLSQRFPALAPRVRRRLMADAEGNPLALLELPAALTASQRTASHAFATRITSLPAPTRHLLLVAALEGSGNLLIVRRAVEGRCGLKHLASAERLRLVHVDEATGRLAFRHSLMRAAVVDLSTSAQRRSAHRALAEAWTGVPEQRAWHLAQAAVDPDEQIADLLEDAAGISARRGDGPNAVAALVRAAELSPAAPERARRLAQAAYLGTILTGGCAMYPVCWMTPAGPHRTRVPGRRGGHRAVPAQQLRRRRHRPPSAVRRDHAPARTVRPG